MTAHPDDRTRTTTTPDPAMAVVTRGLTKTYRTRHGVRTAVDSLDLDVPAGGVHGFLGPNGSGKTTTIRMLLGLVRPGAGTMSIFGTAVPDRLPAVINRVGAIVEAPKFFPHFPARTSLRLLADAIGAPRGRVDEVLEEVGLADRGKDRFATYSLGMKQRLAIAATLLKSPDLLIFDEPTNGLDPAGISEIRGTMRDLGRQGRTVLVSSHILSEVEQVADTVSIIGRGTMLAQGKVTDLIGSSGSDAVEVGVAAAERERAAQVLRSGGWQVQLEDGPGLLLATGGPASAAPGAGAADTRGGSAEITRALADAGIYLDRLLPRRRGLEAVFLELTGTTPADHAMGQQWVDPTGTEHTPAAETQDGDRPEGSR